MFRWTFPQLQAMINMRNERMEKPEDSDPQPTGLVRDLKDFFK